jgi:hypothetical protein
MLLLAAGCTMGIKAWPQPADDDGKFTWRSVTATFEGGCVVVEGRLDGEFKNIESVHLDLEALDAEACAECPFKPSRSKTFRPGTPGFELVGPWMRLRECGLDPSVPVRLRLRAVNRRAALVDVASEVIRIDP